MINRRLLAQMEWPLLFITLAVALAGLANIYSSTFVQEIDIYNRQLQWLAVGLVFMAAAIAFDYTLLDRYGYFIYFLALGLLVWALVFGRTVAGTQRWISLGFVTFQPSEFTKLAVIVILARHFAARPARPGGLALRDLVFPALLIAVPFFLVAAQPDLGTALIFVLIFCSVVLVVKVRLKTAAGLLLAFAPLVPIAWGSLKGYQKARLLSFLDPSSDPLGSGYHLLQSKIAIGSGGFWGKGFTKGTQGKLMFLPEHHTDFIFSILAEEWGLAGSLTVMALFLSLILYGLHVARSSKDRFGFLLALGLSSLFFWHIVINLGMVSGLMPVVGVPLPFFSYGGSFLVTAFIGAGLLINIKMRRFIF
ncbi:MAG TPA: rod shape-determining protein RodA [Deltaproteobacteria bacterium]|nr:rod shape-determining protein RodA [Deltaproteobacteria bacterium]